MITTAQAEVCVARKEIGSNSGQREKSHQAGGILQRGNHIVDAANGKPLKAKHGIKDHVDPKHRIDRWHHEER